jgi:hypothetical protein
VVKARTGRSWVRDPMMSLILFSLYLILPAALGPKVYSASNKIGYQKQRNNIFGSRARPVLTTDNLTAIGEPTV